MSGVILKPGTHVIATLFRPVRSASTIGVTCFVCRTPADADDVARAIATLVPELVASQPTILLPGPPICLLLHVIGMGKDGSAVTSTVAELDRAMSRGQIAVDLIDALPGAALELFKLLETAEGGDSPIGGEATPAPVVH